jgi:KDO2-lipid IV(A) lauroyltransferase
LRWLLAALSLFFRCLPRRAAHAFGAVLGWIWYYLIPVRRSVARANLRLAFPKKPEKERRKIARGCFVHLSRSAVEFLRLPGLDRKKVDKLLEHRGWEHYRRAVQQGRGVIVATAHFGNFDLLACAQAVRGVPLHILTREQHLGGFNRYWMSVRARLGVGLLPAKDSALRIHRLLKRKQVVAMVIDQHVPEGRGVVVPFFGRPASTVHAPALLAVTTGAPLLPATIERLPGGRHRVTIDPPVPVDAAAERETEVLRVTAQLNRWLEDQIRSRPDHWLWIHRRWKVSGVV